MPYCPPQSWVVGSLATKQHKVFPFILSIRMSIRNIAFNQSVSSLSCCTDQGFIIFCLEPELQKKIYPKIGGTGIMKFLNSSNIAVLVGGGDTPYRSRNKLILYDVKAKKSVFEVDLLQPIRNAHIKRNNVIAILDDRVCVFEFSGKLIGSRNTYLNEQGLCAVNSNDENPMIVTLGENKGELAIWYPVTEEIITIKDAHLSNIDAIATNRDGTLIASASEKGTLIRVFCTATHKIKYELRRGTFHAKIHDICFNKNSTRLACTSAHGTVHVFELADDVTTTKNTQSMFSSLSDYVPVVGSQWSFKQGHIDSTDRTICGFDDDNILHVASFDGKYFKMCGKNDLYESIYQGTLHTNLI